MCIFIIPIHNCHQIFLLNGNTARFPCTLKTGIFYLKRFSLLSLKSVFDLFITLERSESILEIHVIESAVSSPFVKAEGDSNRIFCAVFETVCASELAAMCAYQIREHLYLTFADHLDLYSQQAIPNFRFPSEQNPLFSEWIMSLVWNILNRK